MAELVAIAGAVADALTAAAAGGAFGPATFRAVRAYEPEFELEELQDSRVTVVGAVRRKERETREKWEYQYDVEIGIQQRTDGTKADIDQKIRLAEQVDEFFHDEDNGIEGAQFLRSQILPYYGMQHLEQHNVITSLVMLTFVKWR
jgi:hypothetical protein